MAILRDYVVHYNETHDVDATTAMTPQKARQSEEFRNVMKWLRYKSDKLGGRKAQALELLGEREREYEIDRGDDD